MTQIVLYASEEGMMLAGDSRAVAYDTGGDARYLQVRKLFLPTPETVLLTAGAGHGVLACQAFEKHLWETGAADIEEIIRQAPSFLASELRKLDSESPLDPNHPQLHKTYFIIAGILPHPVESPFRFLLLGSESHGDPLHVLQTGNVFAIPRQMGIEYRLTQLSRSGGTLEEAERISESFLTKMAGKSDEVAPPFHFVRITTDGVRVRTCDCLDY